MSGPATARSVALEAIRRVIDLRAYSNLVLPGLLARSRLDARDRAFATELTYGTLRRLLPVDAAIAARASRPVERMSAGARHALRLGAYQLLFAGVAPHAAVGETVALVSARERGFVNAVLHKLADDPPSPPTGSDDEAVSLRTGLSSWAVRELGALVGPEAERAAAALAERAPLCIRANTVRVDVLELQERLASAGVRAVRARVDPDCLLLDGGAPASLPGYDEGWFAVQDQASAFVVRVLDPQPGERVADVCAAPGGKALHVAALVGSGVVAAADLAPARVALIRRQADRLGLRPAVLVQDGTRPALRGGFDRVLVDAPCSGIGSARRRPELLWRVPRDRLTGLAARQVAIAAASADLLRPGGRLVFAVCTFPRSETDAVCDVLVRRRPDLEPIATPGPDGAVPRHRLWPHRNGSDGMFVAAFRRVAGAD
ncbi:MAG TPA: transcription antitermination factor NusB [Actinomycetota bacterium]|nr:transcription antitermination factor NusB [Actinomycetota bacterium]